MDFAQNRWLFARHVVGLLRPGRPGPTHAVDSNTVSPIDDLDDSELDTLLEEGRRDEDRHLAQLDAIRGRAQSAQLTTLALLTVYASQLGPVLDVKRHSWLLGGYIVGAGFAIWGLLGLLSVGMTQVALSTMHPAIVTGLPRPLKASLATEYAHAAIENSPVIATLLSVFREAVMWITLSAGVESLVWIYLKKKAG